MKNRKNILSLGSLAVMLSALFVLGCKKKFDQPATVVDPGVTATSSIKAFKAANPTNSGDLKQITTDVIIKGTVVGNDRSGNIYKSIFIQDTSAGIQIDLDATGLYNIFPVGREVYVLAKGLWIANEENMIRLTTRAINNGVPVASGIPSTLIDKYIKRGSLNNPVTPKVVTVSQLNNDYQSMLIQLDNYEVDDADRNKTFADTSVNKASVNINIKGCTGQPIIVRSSGYASFAAVKVPQGNGSVIAIYTVFRTTKQLVIRDTTDMQLNAPRCGTGPTTLMNISDLRALFTGSPTTAPAGKRITGIVISDRNAKNLVDQNLVLQQGNNLSGIIVRFASAHSFNLGDSIDVNVSGGTLEDFAGTLQVGATSAGVTVHSTGKTITPRVATITNVNANSEAWESTLVRVNNVTVSGGTSGTWAGNTTWNDGTGTITGFTRTGTTGASFQSTAYPTGTITSLTGIVGQFNTTKQLSLRNISDVGTGTGGGGTTLLDETFESTTANTDISLTGWMNAAEVGTQKYQSKLFSSNKYAQITAFSTNEAAVTSWLVTKGINLNATTNEVLTFDTKAGFHNGATLKILVSTNYTGTGNPWAAGVTWTDITSSATLSPGQTSGYPTNFTPSGNISLNSYSGTIYVAFKYEGSDPAGTATDKTSTWQIDNVKVIGN